MSMRITSWYVMPGHFIYYEKNDPMQAYMIDMSENKSIEETEHVPDRAVIDFQEER